MSARYPPAWGLGLAPGTPAGHLPLTRYERQSPQLPGPPPPASSSHSQPPQASTNNIAVSESVSLTIRQQPKEALLTSEGKEKARKPVDPPPIIQLKVDGQADPQQHFLQSPYLFMCVSLWDARKDQPATQDGKPVLAGSLVSSLHRLKDVDNRDGGFFVFGDVSVKIQGTHRLHFSLFDLHKDTHEVHFLKAVTSDPFRVVLPKDFKGMDESTYLSRAFSDQGVRLRLRKEPRAMMGSAAKRSFPYAQPEPQHDERHDTPKRSRQYDHHSDESDARWDHRVSYGTDRRLSVSHSPSYPLPVSHSPGYQSSQAPTYQSSQPPSYQSSQPTSYQSSQAVNYPSTQASSYPSLSTPLLQNSSILHSYPQDGYDASFYPVVPAQYVYR